MVFFRGEWYCMQKHSSNHNFLSSVYSDQSYFVSITFYRNQFCLSPLQGFYTNQTFIAIYQVFFTQEWLLVLPARQYGRGNVMQCNVFSLRCLIRLVRPSKVNTSHCPWLSSVPLARKESARQKLTGQVVLCFSWSLWRVLLVFFGLFQVLLCVSFIEVIWGRFML